ncbi:MAG: hypothetical protein MK085_05560 [Phycisphaerales bacterium]|nr:hypothetical protein [Phycisphaerales bacterium]
MIRSTLFLLPTILLASCAGTPTPTLGTTSTGRPTPVTSTNIEETGLVVFHWRVHSGHDDVDSALDVIETRTRDAIHGENSFRRDGFRVMRLTADEFEDIREVLQENTPMSRTWHGEAISWRDLLVTRVESGAVALENGRAQKLPSGIVALAGRAWSIPTIDAAGVHVQLIPHLVRQRPAREQGRPGALRGVALSKPVEATLGPDDALLVISAAGLLSDSEPSDDPGPSRVASFPAGPGTAMPPTVAELLLDEQAGRIRGILVLQGQPHPSMLPRNSEQP